MAVALVQSKQVVAVNDADGVVGATFDSAPTAGNILVVTAATRDSSYSTAEEPFDATNLDGSGWELIAQGYTGTSDTAHGHRGGMWWKVAGASEPSTITFTSSQSTVHVSVELFEFSHDFTTPALSSAVSSFQSTSSATTVSSGSTGDAEHGPVLWVGFGSIRNGAPSSGLTISPTVNEQGNLLPANQWSAEVGWLEASTPAAQNWTWTCPNSASRWAMVGGFVEGSPAVRLTGGTASIPGDGYVYHTFNESGTLGLASGETSVDVEYLTVAGGGGGGWGGLNRGGGGGGAGGYLSGTALTISSAQTITVGGGGAGGVSANGTQGSGSSIGSLVTATGGGYGARSVETDPGNDGGDGGSGGGGAGYYVASGGTGSQGNDGGGSPTLNRAAGGGGGASAAGQSASGDDGGDGGAGTAWNGTTYAGGGGGGTRNFPAVGDGGAGGGGTGSSETSAGTAGTANSGGGGGGGAEGSTYANGYAGGSGIVIIRYAIAAAGITGTASPTLTRATAAGSGSTGTEGTGSPTLARHTAAGSGSTTAPLVAPTFVSSFDGASQGGVSLNLPPGATDGDVLFVIIEGEGEDANADAMSTPGDWTFVGSVASSTAGNLEDTRASLYYTVYDSASPPDYNVADAGDHTFAVITAWRGVDAAVMDVTATSATDGAGSTSHTGAGITTATDKALVVVFAVHGDGVTLGSRSIPNADSTVVDYNETTTAGSDGTITIFHGVMSTAGASGSPTWSTTAAEEMAAWTIALRADGASPSGPTGTAAVTLNRHVGLGAGTALPPTSGTGALALNRHTAAGVGSIGAEGSSATTLTRHTAAGSGLTATAGSSATTLNRHTVAGSGATGPSGSGAGTLARHTLVGSGSTGVDGSGTPSLARHVAVGAGSTSNLTVTGSGAPTMQRAEIAGLGTTAPPTSGSGAPTLTRSSAAGVGSTGTEGTGTPTLTRHSANGAGSTTQPNTSGSGALSLARATAAGTGSTQAVTPGSGSPTLGRHIAAGVGSTGTNGTGTLVLQRATAQGFSEPVEAVSRSPWWPDRIIEH